MRVALTGYFDNNFGDDYMMKIIAHYLPEVDFYIDDRENASELLLKEKNVHISSADDITALPVLTVTGSGFMVNSRDALICEIIWLIKRKHVTDICVGCNIEPFDSRFKEWLIARKLNKLKLISCRDKKSLCWLKKHCKKPELNYSPDILFSMPDEWIGSNNNNNNNNKLGISLMHRTNDSENSDYYTKMAEIADYWIENKRTNVILTAFDAGSENDVLACECVKKHMKAPKEKIEVVSHGANGEIINAFAQCEKVIGARFHSMVLALKMKIDFFPIIYREKMRNIISDLNYPLKGEDIDSINVDNIKAFIDSDELSYKIDAETCELAKGHVQQLRICFRKGLTSR